MLERVFFFTPNWNGIKSSNAHDIPTDFQLWTFGRTVISDYAFIQDASRNFLILAASTDKNVDIIDL